MYTPVSVNTYSTFLHPDWFDLRKATNEKWSDFTHYRFMVWFILRALNSPLTYYISRVKWWKCTTDSALMNASIITVHLTDFVFAKFLLTLKYVDHRWILKDKAGDVLYCCHCQQIPRLKPTMLQSVSLILSNWSVAFGPPPSPLIPTEEKILWKWVKNIYSPFRKNN